MISDSNAKAVYYKRTETDNPPRHCHHPEHAIDGGSMRGGSEDVSDDDHQSREDDGGLSAQIVAGQTVFDISGSAQMFQDASFGPTRRRSVR